MDNKSFPVFKRYRHGKTWLRIDSPESMTEVRVLGQSYNVLSIHARILPERLLISDLLLDETDALECVSENQFDSFLKECQNTKVLREF